MFSRFLQNSLLASISFNGLTHLEINLLSKSGITIRVGDGTLGWSEQAPFDAITAAAVSPDIPAPFLSQLREGGHLVMPTGSGNNQTLVLLEKRHGTWQLLKETPCRFVRMIGKYGCT